MNIEDIKETSIWQLYEKGRNYHRMVGIYADTDRNYRFFNGNQWDGAKLGDVEPVQKNFIKPIVKYKVSVIHDNLYAMVFSSQNYENREFQKESGRYCDMLNRYASRVWEKDKMDFKGRRITKDAAINDEGMMAGSMGFQITIEGQGGHGSRPDQSNNPIDCFVAIYQRLQALRLTKVDPFKTCTYSVGLLQSGR